MKEIIRLTESELHAIIGKTVRSLLDEDVLGDDWRQREEDDYVMNNYEPFQSQTDNDDEYLEDDFDDEYLDNDFNDERI